MYTNTSRRSDFFENAFLTYSTPPCNVLIAVAFLTDADRVLDLVRRGCSVKLIVRLGFPTSPKALRKLVGVPGVQVKYINNPSFHPKLYIFAERCAVVGSSNLTMAALRSNQEVNVTVPASDHRFEDLVALYSDYWGQVRTLDSTVIDAYERVFNKYRKAQGELEQMDLDVKGLAPTQIDNIGRDPVERDSEDVFLEDYKATYVVFLEAFRNVRRLYVADGRRKVPEEAFPLRLEIDSFLSWVRDAKTSGESYLNEPLLRGDASDAKVAAVIREWFEARYRFFEEDVVPDRYPRIVRVLGTDERLASATYDEIIDALSAVNSFYDRLRFFPGGHDAHVAAFVRENDLGRVRQTLRYLLFGRDDYIVRMGRCIFDPRYKLGQFGRSAVQELLGWINSNEIPVCNNRTLRSLRWMGFDVALVGG